ncbi:MAG: ATP-dependent 6-phosphofructokinase, partial [Planctomycetota bacterium]|nr:ATP-dependent 6-phosphofructokinase [Planctomycetota bacterium]
STRRIGILTGGGDCPGLNAVIRAVAKTAIYQHNWEVFGIEDGFLGLVQNRIHPLTATDVSGILTVGGTILGSSNKCNPERYAVGFDESGEPRFENVTDRVLEHLKHHHLDTLVVIGGDGTMTGAHNLVENGINCVGLPKTIDNDLLGTDITFGFMTAVQTATEAIDRLHTTAQSHHRVMIVELMGRNAGWIALHAGIASGSDVILIPEIPYDLAAVCEYVQKRNKRGKRFSLVCVSEGAKPRGGKQIVSRIDPTSPDPVRLGGIGNALAEDIERVTNIETRATVLGHVVRGGTPVAADRVLATQLGNHAVKILAENRGNRLVVMRNLEVTDIDIREAAGGQRLV